MGKLYQKYMDEFKCIAGECPDTCCAMWQICLDEQTADDYLNDSGEVGRIAREYMRGKSCSRRLALKDGKCPYLDENKLCKVILNNGENALCTVCSMHPRFIHPLYEDSYEFLSLSCPQAVRMFLSSVNNGGVRYMADDLQNPYLSQFYEYVCEICLQFSKDNQIESLFTEQFQKENFEKLVVSLFGEMEFLEKNTKNKIVGFTYESFIDGYRKLIADYGKGAFGELFKYFALMLYDERSPVLPVAFTFAVVTTYLYGEDRAEKAIYKFVKETEHSERNVKRAVRIMRSPKAKNILRSTFCFSSLY